MRDAGAVPYDYLYSTVTLAGYLQKNGYKRISVNQDWDAEAGDIILMSWGNDMSTSGGAGGHVGVMKDSIRFISVDYWTGGNPGTAVSEHVWNNYYAVQRPNYIEVWRLAAGSTSNGFAVGQKVKLLNHATQYQTLERIPSWVKNKTYTVQQVKTVNNPNSKRAYLLKEIHSWVLQQDLE
ncbi:peptidoglycan amidohydrolase family protein [Enterococcus sp. LJL128]